MSYDFSQHLQEDEKKYGVGKRGEYFSLQDGDNKIRVLSPGAPMAQHFLGQKTPPAICIGVESGCPHHGDNSVPARLKWLMFVYDYQDEKIKLARMPYTIIKSIADFQKSPDYVFTELPMPYDITIRVQNGGTKEVKYSVIPARANTDLPIDVVKELSKKGDIFLIVEKFKERAKKAMDITPDEQGELNPSEIFNQ